MIEKINGYGSHLPVFEEIFKIKEIKSLVEFGCGDFSTDYFIKNCPDVTSIEMQSQEWFDKIHNKFKDSSSWKGILCLGPFEFQNLSFKKIDLAFVDGHGDSRPEQINKIHPYTNIIVAHDTETYSYRWERIMFFREFHKFEYTELRPYTTVWSTDKTFIEELRSKLG